MFLQQLGDGEVRVITSASDLTAASTCEFAFLRRVDARLGRDVVVPPDDDPMLARAARLGDAHEERVLQRYRDQLADVAEIDRADSRDPAALAAAETETVTAMERGADVVFQATFFEPEVRAAEGAEPAIGFIGYADFLRRNADGTYEVQDTKLARRAKVTALMQLAAYAEQLERLGVRASPEVVLILGDGSRSTHKLADIAPVFRSRRSRMHELLLERVTAAGSDGARATAAPIAWGESGVISCGRCEVCEPEIERTRDPLLIAGIRAAQRDRLIDAGLDTIDAVAAVLPAISSGVLSVEGIAQPALERLAMQAAMQLVVAQGGVPPYRVVDPLALAVIPRPNPGDLFFDFEGDPLYREPGSDESARWGLDYLFGMVDTSEQFTPLWAHDLEAEREALLRFLQLVDERRSQHPGMRIYHYAPYERTHLLSIAARHGVGEAEVDCLLREHVLVDLYPVVRSALRVGTRSYSIKKLEPLYMGGELRNQDGVTNGAQSVTEYAEASAQLLSGDASERDEGQRRLDAIADYNRYDCVSTLRLRDWLLRLAAEHGVEPAPLPPADEREAATELELSPVAKALAEHASRAEDPTERKAAALAGSAIDYYQREQKSFWWAHFARLVDPIEDWADTRDVLIVDPALSNSGDGWQAPQGRERSHRRRLTLRGELAPGSSLKEGSEVYLLYATPVPFAVSGAAPGARGTRMARVAERLDNGVIVEELRGKDLPEWSALPIAIVPGPPPRAGAQKAAIEEWGAALAAALDAGEAFADPVYDIMRRVPPRLHADAAIIEASSEEAFAAGGGEDARTIGAVIATLRRLDRSALAVQGPPGTGKTYLAARVIRTLVERDGWHVGVVAQSHRVVENVLEGVVAAGLSPMQVAKVPQGGKLQEGDPEPSFTVLGNNGHARFVADQREAGRGSVIGGTAWDFSNEARVPRGSLDLLVIDEAGQFSLAPTIAASVAAQRLLLLGDPQQLPQVSQGSHPEPVDSSALGWLLGEHETIAEGKGYFLEETRRMRPELADVVSELAYEGRLHAHPSASLREVTRAGRAGLVWHSVEHFGNSTSSVEEAAEVVRIVQQSLRGSLTESGETPRALHQDDVIAVAAYNAQVECLHEALSAAGLGQIRVGTVDKFQGQEAAIAIVSLAASSGDDVPRGLDFLLMRNRLNVAISRAQWAAHLVSSARLGEGLPHTAEGVAALSGYLRLLERGTAGTRAAELS